MAERLLVQVTGGRLLVSITVETDKWHLVKKFSELHSHKKKKRPLHRAICVLYYISAKISDVLVAQPQTCHWEKPLYSQSTMAPFLRTSSKRTLNLTPHSFRASTTFNNMNKLYRLHGKSYQHDQGLKFKSFSSQCQVTAQRKGKKRKAGWHVYNQYFILCKSLKTKKDHINSFVLVYYNDHTPTRKWPTWFLIAIWIEFWRRLLS